mmetsp:Transcript_6516/g.11988  ORF Transcript_6516/g.11988 Transcript_6516/m.11988 type:complete len:269 (+) Transcript_6516:209-1015(+)
MLSFNKLREGLSAYISAGGVVRGPSREIDVKVLKRLVADAGMDRVDAEEYIHNFTQKFAKKDSVSFDRFFKELVRIQCYRAVLALKNDKKDKITTPMQRSEVLDRFKLFFAEEDAKEIVRSIYRFLKVPERCSLAPSDIGSWYRRAYSQRNHPKSDSACAEHKKTCRNHQTSDCATKFKDLNKSDQTIIEALSKFGKSKNWSGIQEYCAKINKEYFQHKSPKELEARWNEIRPLVEKQMKTDGQMACGHSCSTCPTRQTCELHDIEDL